jgi:signal transduction histidine kinase
MIDGGTAFVLCSMTLGLSGAGFAFAKIPSTQPSVITYDSEVLAEILDHAPTSFSCFVKSPDGHYIWANKAARKRLGVSAVGDLPDVPIDRALLNEGVLAMDAEVVEAKGTAVTREILFEGRFYAAIKFLLSDGNIAGMALDITDQRVLEREVTASRRMDSLGELAQGVTHDFYHVLGLIRNYLKFLLKDVDKGASDEKIEEDVKVIMEALTQGENLARQLTTFARQTGGNPEDVNLSEICQHVSELLRFPGIEIITDLDNVPTVRLDPVQAEQVVMNLAVNARDAMPEGGTLKISTEYGRSHVLLRVGDTGEGIDPMIQDRVFDPFFSTKEAMGTGLGLSTVWGIVTKAGGTVSLDSIPKHGTTVTVSVPF